MTCVFYLGCSRKPGSCGRVAGLLVLQSIGVGLSEGDAIKSRDGCEGVREAAGGALAHVVYSCQQCLVPLSAGLCSGIEGWGESRLVVVGVAPVGDSWVTWEEEDVLSASGAVRM